MSWSHFPVPHNARLERPIEPGQLIMIKGRMLDVTTDGDSDPRMTINFATSGQGYDAPTIVFHTSFRFKEKATVMNNKDNFEWGKEERKKMPLKLGEPFDIRIRCHGDKYELMVDQKDFAEFEHRKPLSQVSHIFIDGPIVLENVNWGGKYYSVPYESGISTGFGPGKRMIVSGVPEDKCERFNINLLSSNGDIAFQFNPRFNENCVVRNTKQSGEWQKEEREGKFPFDKKKAFDIVIQNEQYSFQVYVNNEQFCAYAHRCDPNSITGVQVQGDIEMQSIMVV